MNTTMLNIAHRGASGYEPENTIRSFKRALDLGAGALGIDVHVCKSGEVVVIHDSTTDRTTDRFGKVSEMNLRVLRELDAGKGEHISTLQEVLDFVDRRMKLDIELKEVGCAKPTYDVIRYATENGWSYDDFFISSFLRSELDAVRALDERVQLSVLFDWLTQHRAMEYAEKIGAYSINPLVSLVDEDLIRTAHEKGIKVFPWVANEKEDIMRMKSLGVDAIFSDYPDRVQ